MCVAWRSSSRSRLYRPAWSVPLCTVIPRRGRFVPLSLSLPLCCRRTRSASLPSHLVPLSPVSLLALARLDRTPLARRRCTLLFARVDLRNLSRIDSLLALFRPAGSCSCLDQVLSRASQLRVCAEASSPRALAPRRCPAPPLGVRASPLFFLPLTRLASPRRTPLAKQHNVECVAALALCGLRAPCSSAARAARCVALGELADSSSPPGRRAALRLAHRRRPPRHLPRHRPLALDPPPRARRRHDLGPALRRDGPVAGRAARAVAR